MNVPARGGVMCATNESPGAMTGATRVPEPLHPATPSYRLSSSMPCQWTAVGCMLRFTTVIAVGSPMEHLASLLVAVDAEYVVIGGGLIDPGATTPGFRERYLRIIRESALPYLWPQQRAKLQVLPASLGELSQAIGAALVALAGLDEHRRTGRVGRVALVGVHLERRALVDDRPVAGLVALGVVRVHRVGVVGRQARRRSEGREVRRPCGATGE